MAKKPLGLLGLLQHRSALAAVLLTTGCGDSGHEFSTDGVLNDPLVSPASSIWLGSAQYTYTKTRKECWALVERQQNDPDAGAAPELSWTISDGVECTNPDTVELTTTIDGEFSYEFALVLSAEGYEMFVVPGSFAQSNSPVCSIESPSQTTACIALDLVQVPDEFVVESDGLVRGSIGTSGGVNAQWRDSKSYTLTNGAQWQGPVFTTNTSGTGVGRLPAWEISVSDLFDAEGLPRIASAQSGDTTSEEAESGDASETLTYSVALGLHPLRITSPSGDPSAAQGMPGTNEFVFEAGLLEIPLRAEVIGEHGLRSETLDWLEPRLSWSFDPVGDSHDSSPSVPSEQVQTQWCAPKTSGPCEGGVGSVGSVARSASTYGVQLKLVGLPRRYDDFGPKGFELGFDPFLDDPSFVPYPVGEAVAEVFFDPSGVDHPVSDSITMTQDELRVPPGGRPVGEGFPVLIYETSGALEPNWAYYYSQIAQDLAEETLVLRYVSDAEETPVPFTAATPKMSDWLYFQGNPSTVWMARGMFGLVVNSLGEETLGINAFANIIAHESRHIDDVYLMSDPANCGSYWARSLEPEGLQSGWGVSANASVISKDDWAFNRYEEQVIEGVFNEGLDLLLDDDGDGMCNNGDELPKEFNELEIRADDSMLFPRCTPPLWNETQCDLARLDWGADGFNYARRGIFGF